MDEQISVDGALDEELLNLSRLETKDSLDSFDFETMVARICDEMEGVVDRVVVEQVVREISFRYRDARVKAFIPIFVKRDAMDLLRRR